MVGISNASRVRGLAAGAIALLATGELRAWGGSDDGTLGEGTNDASNVPVAVSGIVDAVDIATPTTAAFAKRAAGGWVDWRRTATRS